MNLEQLIEAAKIEVAEKGEEAMDVVRELVLTMFMEQQPVMMTQPDGTQKPEGFRYLPSNWRTLETCGVFLNYRAMADAILSILKESLADKQLVIEAMQANLEMLVERAQQAEAHVEALKDHLALLNPQMGDTVPIVAAQPKNATCPSCDAVEIDHGNCIELKPFCDGSCETYQQRCRANFGTAPVSHTLAAVVKALCEAPPAYPNFPCVQKPIVIPEAGEEQTEIRFKDGSVLRLAERVSDAARAALLAMGATVRVRRPKEVE